MNIAEIPSRSVEINPLSIIDRIIAGVELTRTQHEEARKSYVDVADALQILSPHLKASIFPQGSMRLGTTVRPLLNDRFDLDMICWLEGVSGKHNTPDQVFNLVWDALGQSAVYKLMRSKKNRCIRLEYSDGRKFYLDVTPAVPDWAGGASLYVPDRTRKLWCSSHPIGFCDHWFTPASKVLPVYAVKIANARSSATLMASNAYVEPMPKYGEFEKTPLQRIVQLVKRDRDEFFKNNLSNRPSSILLTTIVTQSYSSLVGDPVQDLFEFVLKVIAKMPTFILSSGQIGSRKFYVHNPVNSLENFAEDWTEETFRHFQLWHDRAFAALQASKESKGKGTDVMLKGLAENFGSENVIRAAKALGADANFLHEHGKLRVAGGTIGVVGAAIPKTIFYGSAK